MAGSVNMFNTGKSGLFASRSALTTTGHNIANVNTEGFSRQRVEQSSNLPQKIGNTTFGNGVRVAGIQRINDEYLTKQIADETKFMGQYAERDFALAQSDAIFNELNNEGLNRLLSRFFNEFRKLGNEPESEALRATVRESSDQLIGDFHRISRSLRDIQKNIDVRLDSNVRQANEMVERVADLNATIKRYELNAGQAGDLRDKRDQAIKQLSEIADISVASNERGELTVALAGVGPLVSGTLINKLYLETAKANPENGRPEGGLTLRLEHNNDDTIGDRLKNSKLFGLLETRDRTIGDAIKRMDELAYTFATRVNEVHRVGYNINGSTGINFFKEPGQIMGAAETLSLSHELKSDANNIATGLLPDSPGDNRVVQIIAKLQHQRMLSGGRSTLDDHYNAMVSDLATINQKNREVMSHQTHIVEQLEKFRQSIAGVSIDEETMNLVQYQQAFNASAKVIQVADEMLDTVMSIKR